MLEGNPRSRWEQFDDVELTTISGALGLVGAGIIDSAISGGLSRTSGDRMDAAATLMVTSRILFDIEDHLGNPHPTIEQMEAFAADIARGEVTRPLGEAA